MNLQVKAYMCVTSTGEVDNLEIFTSSNYRDLVLKVIDNVMDTLGDEYPDLEQFQIPSSIDFISDYDEDDYRSLLNEIICFLVREGSNYTAKIFELDQEINNEHLVNISHDVL